MDYGPSSRALRGERRPGADEVRRELGTVFGYDAKSRDVGISGAMDLVEVDGPTIVVKLTG